MKLISGKINKSEVFPCSFKSAKKIFADTTCTLNFAEHGKYFGTFARTPDAFFVKKNIQGVVVAATYMYEGNDTPFISFYVIKADNYNDNLRKRFELEILPKIYQFVVDLQNTHRYNFDSYML